MPPLADQEDGEENSDEESSDWVGYDTFLERCNFMREMLSAAKRPKKMHFLSSVLKKNEFFGGGKKSGIRVFIEAWYLSTRLPGGWFEKIRTLNTNEDTSPLTPKISIENRI